MIKKRGTFEVHNGRIDAEEIFDVLEQLPDGQYNYMVYDNNKNRSLPQLKYLCGVVLHAISEQLPEHPTINALYRYYEEKFAPSHVCNLQGQEFHYQDLKNETSTEVNDIIVKIIHHATTQLGVHIPTIDDMKLPGAKELYTDAYAEMWKLIMNK